MKVLWRSDMDQGKHDPLEITHVVTKSGSQISAALVVPVLLDGDGSAWSKVQAQSPDAGLLEVIEAQLAAIDEISRELSAAETALENPQDQECSIPSHKGHEALEEWADQFPDMIANLCAALGYAAHPVGPTGIPELDILVSLSR